MPIFDYFCTYCGARTELLVFPGEEENKICPACGQGTLVRRLSAPAPPPKSLARPTGHTCCGRAERCDQPPCNSGGTCARR